MWSDFCVSRHINFLKYTSPACIVDGTSGFVLCVYIKLLILNSARIGSEGFNIWYCHVITQTCSLKKY